MCVRNREVSRANHAWQQDLMGTIKSIQDYVPEPRQQHLPKCVPRNPSAPLGDNKGFVRKLDKWVV